MKIVIEKRQQWREQTTVGPLQLRRALRAAGLMTDLQAYLATAPEEVQEAWEYATTIPRLDPLAVAIQQATGKTDAEVDQLFELAMTY